MKVTAADRCSTHLNNVAVTNYNTLSALNELDRPETVDVSLPSESVDDVFEMHLEQPDVEDAIVCESIRKACSQIGHDIKGVAESGTTVNTLFLRWGDGQKEGAAGTVRCPVRAYCANVGDSRCIMLRSYETKQVLVTSTFGQSRSQTDLSTLSSVKPTELTPTPLAAPSYDGNGVDIPAIKSVPAITSPIKKKTQLSKLSSTSTSKLMSLGNPISSSKLSNDHRFVAVHLFSEDHKLSLHRERLRIYETAEGKVPAGNETECWHVLPADASAIYLPHYAKTLPPASFVGLPACGLHYFDDNIGESC